MKLSILTCGLLAAFIAASPVSDWKRSDAEKYPMDYTSGNVTGLALPVLADNLVERDLVSAPVERDLVKRANLVFIVWPNSNCAGTGTQITRDGNGAKGDFNPAQLSVRILSLTNGWHLSLYTGLQQSGIITRFTASNVGASQCWNVIFNGQQQSFLSYGLFSS